MILTFRPIKVWPEGWYPARNAADYSPFSASYSDTLEVLDRELAHLRASDPILQVAAEPGQVRLDGQLRADAKVEYHGVILSFDTKKFGALSYPCNRYAGRFGVAGWQANLRAIALGLEALRKVERYGIAQRGQQYAGWAELPTGIAMGAGMTVEEAARFIVDHCGLTDPEGVFRTISDTPGEALQFYRDAAKQLHPDTGGDSTLFRKLLDAKALLEEAA